MKISCVVSQAGCVFPLLMAAPFNYSWGSLLAITTYFFLFLFFNIQDLKSGSSGWVADLGFFFLIGACVCSPIFCAERGFFRGGGGRWKRNLMNGDSQNGGCGSLKTQARWIELRLTGTCPLSFLTQTRYSYSLHAVWRITQTFDLFPPPFFFFNNRFIKRLNY